MISSLELARLCNVSQGTVDRALHNRSGIAAKTRDRILEMAEKHGYMANPAALEIMGRGSKMIGVLTPVLNSPLIMEMIRIIQDTISVKGYKTYTVFFEGEDGLLDGIRDFASRKAAGIIVFSCFPGFKIPDNLINTTKIISLLEPFANDNATFISPNNYRIGQMCADTLLRLGHKNILMVDFNLDRLTVKERSAGFKETVSKSGGKPSYMFSDDIELSLIDIVKREKITAIYGHADVLALKAMHILEEAGYSIPDDISILGGQDNPAFKEFFPNLSNFDYPTQSLANSILAALEEDVIPEVLEATLRKGTTLSRL